MTNIRKTTLQINVFHRADDDLSNYTVMDILDECEVGSMIRSSVEVIGTPTIITDPNVLREELEAIGNDGTFFDDDDALASLTEDALREECTKLSIRVVQSEDAETYGLWDWIGLHDASDTSFDTERLAMLDALTRFDEE